MEHNTYVDFWSIRRRIKSRKFVVSNCESVLLDVSHSQQLLLFTKTNATLHENFLNFNQKSCCGISLPNWLINPGPVLLRNFVKTHKNDDFVPRVELTEVKSLQCSSSIS